jgi:hypothetical protein
MKTFLVATAALVVGAIGGIMLYKKFKAPDAPEDTVKPASNPKSETTLVKGETLSMPTGNLLAPEKAAVNFTDDLNATGRRRRKGFSRRRK